MRNVVVVVLLLACFAMGGALYATAAPATQAPTNGQLSAQIKSLKAKVYNLTWRLRATEVNANTALCAGGFSLNWIVRASSALRAGNPPPGISVHGVDPLYRGVDLTDVLCSA